MAKKNQRKDMLVEIEIPNGIKIVMENNLLKMSKEGIELQRNLDNRISYKLMDDKIILESKNSTKNKRKIFGSAKAHINNMVRGLTKGFTYKLEIANVHFPMTASVNKETNSLVVKNFLGEKKDRIIKLTDNIEVKVNKNQIEITSPDIEKAGQCAANIEKGTKIKNRDRRVFQDGIFITQKPGRQLL